MNQAELINRLKVMGVSLLVQALIGYADYITGSELHLDVFYFIPIAICAWYLRRADVMVSAFAGALTWGYADIRGGHHYARIIFWYWNVLVSFSSLLAFGLAMCAMRDNLQKKEEARQELLRMLNELKQSADQTEKLREQLHVICAWTKRIRVDGKWLTLEEFLKTHLNVDVSHGISPEAFEQLKRNLQEDSLPTPPPEA